MGQSSELNCSNLEIKLWEYVLVSVDLLSYVSLRMMTDVGCQQ